MLNSQKLLGNLKKGLLFVISAPAGTGKNTLVDRLKEEFSNIQETVSYTSRKARLGEREGVHYHFVTDTVFKEMESRNEFLESVILYDTYYGTSKKEIEMIQKQQKHAVLVIDTQGVEKLKQQAINAVYIFIMPPSIEELRKRLVVRATEATDVIEKRLKVAAIEMTKASMYDYIIVNDDREIAYQVLKSIFIAEGHRTQYIKGDEH